MEYRTVARKAQGEFIEKRSRFIGYIKPLQTQEQALEFIAQVKTKHWDATHNVTAYVLRDGGVQRYSDDGEPQGTAGMPTLDVLLKEELTDCAVVVTRYFGGTKLGAGGLVRAYSRAAKIAVDAGKIITMTMFTVLEVECDYSFYGKLTALVPESNGVIEDTRFAENVTVRLRIPTAGLERFNADLADLSFGSVKSEQKGETYAEIEKIK
ncbi:MAG TPA: YigZ family protein [Clostridia bacterium]|nr:YigZ family protein [Clostridia bacterium]